MARMKQSLLLLSMICIVIFAGCGADNSSMKPKVVSGSESEEPTIVEQSDPENYNRVGIGDIIDKKNICRAEILSMGITDCIKPENPGEFYTYYEPNKGKKFVDLLVKYSNRTDNDPRCDEAIAIPEISYGDGHRIEGDLYMEYEDRNQIYEDLHALEPQSTAYIHIVFEVPDSIEKEKNSIEIGFVIDNESYTSVLPVICHTQSK